MQTRGGRELLVAAVDADGNVTWRVLPPEADPAADVEDVELNEIDAGTYLANEDENAADVALRAALAASGWTAAPFTIDGLTLRADVTR